MFFVFNGDYDIYDPCFFYGFKIYELRRRVVNYGYYD